MLVVISCDCSVFRQVRQYPVELFYETRRVDLNTKTSEFSKNSEVWHFKKGLVIRSASGNPIGDEVTGRKTADGWALSIGEPATTWYVITVEHR